MSAAALLPVLSHSASAGQTNWDGSNGNWTDATHWSAGVPSDPTAIAYLPGNSSGDYVVTYQLASATAIHFLQIDGFHFETPTISVDHTSTLLQANDATVLLADSELIGVDSPDAIFTQSGGTNRATVGLTLGFNAGAAGSYNLSGTARLNAPAALVGDSGLGTFVQSGGTFNAGALELGENPGSTGNYILNGGSLAVAGHEYVGVFGGALGHFVQSGGSQSVAGDLVVQNGSYALSAGSLDAHLLHVNTEGTFNQTGGDISSATTVQLAGGSITGTFVNNGTFVYQNGSFNGRLVNRGTVNINPAGLFEPGNGVENDAALSLPTGTTIRADGAGLSNLGAVNLSGGELGGAGPLVNSGLLTGVGTISGSGGFTNAFTLTQGPGTLTLSNTGTNSNTGTITLASGYSFQLAATSLQNSGVINLNGGQTTGSGTLINAAGGSIVGPGAIASGFGNSGQLVVQNGMLRVASPFFNGGQIILTPGGTLASGLITSLGTLQGAGLVTSDIDNKPGGTIEPVGGVLTLTGTVSNSGTINLPGGAKLTVAGGLASNGGNIELTGGTFDNGAQPMSNAGNIIGFGDLRTGGLTNKGSITFSGGSATLDGDLTNSAGQTVAVTNTPALFTGSVKNGGTIKTTKTTLTILGAYTGQPGSSFLSDPADNYFQSDVSLQAGASISGGAGDRFFLSGGSFKNAGTYDVAGTLQTSDPITNTGTFTQTGTLIAAANFSNSGTANIGGAQLWSAGTVFSNTAGAANFLSDAGAAGATLALAVSGGRVTIASDQHLAGLTITGGTVDLKTGNLFLHHSGGGPSAAIRGYLQGHMLLTSSGDAAHVLGYADSADGVVTGLAPDTLLVKFTRLGDVNLDGTVNFADLLLLAQHYGGGNAFWDQGDLNYDGSVNFSDLLSLAQNYGQSAAGIPAGFSAIPEPATAATLPFGLAVLAQLRRRRTDPAKV